MADQKDAAQFLYDRCVGDDPELQAKYRRYQVDSWVSMEVHEIREQSGMSRIAFAEWVDVTPEVVDQLERADYPGDSVEMLRKIAALMGKHVTFPAEWMDPGNDPGNEAR